MRHFLTSTFMFSIFLIVMLGLCSFTCSAKMTAFLVKKEADIAVQRGDEGIEKAKQNINDSISEIADELAEKTFNDVSSRIYDNNITVSEAEANEIYSKRFFVNFKEYIGRNNEDIENYLVSKLPETKTGNLKIDKENMAEYASDDGRVSLKNITLKYNYKNNYSTSEVFDVGLNIPYIILYDGNDEIFSYAMIAKKGIYMTGKTSTVFGSVFAGKHGPEEMRKSEALYAERDRYGGLNIMATQAAIYGDKVISEGDINLRGSFVLFGSEDEPTEIYTHSINEMDNVAQKNIFGHVGKINQIDDRCKERDVVDLACETFGEIEFYYDSDNDRFYNGTYRKIISAFDVTLKSDVTGIVMAAGNVIIEDGVNVEGLIICGDRIYIQGNNNIVNSKEVLHTIVKEELYGDMYVNTELDDDEATEMSSMHLNVVDYLGGMDFRGYSYR